MKKKNNQKSMYFFFLTLTDYLLIYSRVGILLVEIVSIDLITPYLLPSVFFVSHVSLPATSPSLPTRLFSVFLTAGHGEACTEAHLCLAPRDRYCNSIPISIPEIGCKFLDTDVIIPLR